MPNVVQIGEGELVQEPPRVENLVKKLRFLAFFYHAVLCYCDICYGPVRVCMLTCLSLDLICFVKMAKHIIVQTTPWMLVFGRQSS